MSEKENLSGKRDTETLILAKDSGKQFTSGGSGVHLRGGEWCSRCPLLDKHFYLHIKTPSAPKPETTAKKISSAILFYTEVAIRFFMVHRVGVRRFNERETPNKLRRDDEAEGRRRQLL